MHTLQCNRRLGKSGFAPLRRSAMNEQVVTERRHSASDIVGVVLYSIVVLLVMLLWVYVPA